MKSSPVLAEADCTLEQLQALFDATFLASHNTRLIQGGDEPLYMPANNETPYHQVILAHGFIRSALHEISHWCIAGDERRQQVDYGYWYQPDGRDVQAQKDFEQVEFKPQALEWIFSKALGVRFRVSVDNLSGAPVDPGPFKQAVVVQAQKYLEKGLPGRARLFLEALQRLTQRQVQVKDFQLDQL